MTQEINWKKNLFFVWLSQFLAMAGFGCCMPFIPLLLRDNLHIMDDQVRGFYVSLYALCGMASLCIASAVWGILADRFGRKLMLLRASYAAALFYPLLAFAPNIAVLLLIRFAASFFSGTVNPAQTLLVTTTPDDRHGFVLGTLSTSIWSGSMTGYLCGGMIVHYFGYTAAFMTCGIIYLLSGLLVQFFVEEHFVRPVKSQSGRPAVEKVAFTPGLCWLFGMFLFMGIARRIEQPFVAMQVEVIHGRTDAAFYTGIVSAAAALGGVFSGILIGRLCDRYSPQKIIFPILLAGGLLSLLQAYSWNIWGFIAARFFAFLAAGGIQPSLQVMLSGIIRPEQRGRCFGWTSSLHQAGGIICALLSGSIAYFADVRTIFAAAGVLTLIMIPLMIPTVRACRRQQAGSAVPDKLS